MAAEVEEGSSEDEDAAQLAAFMEQGDFYKMVFVVNVELNMGTGKIAAQVCINVSCEGRIAEFMECLVCWSVLM